VAEHEEEAQLPPLALPQMPSHFRNPFPPPIPSSHQLLFLYLSPLSVVFVCVRERVCVCVCVCARARVCVRVYVFVCLFCVNGWVGNCGWVVV